MAKGMSSVRDAAADIEARKNAGGGGSGLYFKLGDGESAVVRFLEEGDDVQWAWVHELPPTQGRSFGQRVPCRDQDENGQRTGEPCPGCDRELKRTFQGVINLIWRDGPIFERDSDGKMVKDDKNNPVVASTADVVAVWTAGITVFEELEGIDVTFKGLKSRDFKVTRKGLKLNTRYTIQPANPDGGPQPLSKEDEELAEGKTDLTAMTAPPSYEDWGKSKSDKKAAEGQAQTSTADVSPFMRGRS